MFWGWISQRMAHNFLAETAELFRGLARNCLAELLLPPSDANISSLHVGDGVLGPASTPPLLPTRQRRCRCFDRSFSLFFSIDDVCASQPLCISICSGRFSSFSRILINLKILGFVCFRFPFGFTPTEYRRRWKLQWKAKMFLVQRTKMRASEKKRVFFSTPYSSSSRD